MAKKKRASQGKKKSQSGEATQNEQKGDTQKDEEAQDAEKEEEEDETTVEQRRKAARLNDNTSTLAAAPIADDNNKEEEKEAAETTPLQKRAPTFDSRVHRVRHIRYEPRAVVCIRSTPPPPRQGSNSASPPTTTTTATMSMTGLCAVSRADGSVELRTVSPKMRTISVVQGFRNRPVHVLAWTCGGGQSTTVMSKSSRSSPNHTLVHYQPLLVGALEDGTLAWVDFEKAQLTHLLPSTGGRIACLVSLCQKQVCKCPAQKISKKGCFCQRPIAAGHQDGCVRIYQLQPTEFLDDEDEKQELHNDKGLQLVSTLPSVHAPVLSLAWRRRRRRQATVAGEESDQDKTVLFVGVADGTIRRFDGHRSQNGASSSSLWTWKSMYRITLESRGRNIPTRAWALQLVQASPLSSSSSSSTTNMTLVSGNSLGQVQFWNGDTGTLESTMVQSEYKADVLDLDVTTDEAAVFATGVDSRVISVERKLNDNDDGTGKDANNHNKWVLTTAQRPHTHDVRSLTITTWMGQEENNSDSSSSMIVTGGIDTKLCTYDPKEFTRKRPRIHFSWPCQTPYMLATRSGGGDDADAAAGRLALLRRQQGVQIHRLAQPPTLTAGSSTTATPQVVIPMQGDQQQQEQATLLGTVYVKSTYNLVCAAMSPNGRWLAVNEGRNTLLFRLGTEESSDKDDFSPTKIPIDMSSSSLPKRKSKSAVVALHFVDDNRLVMAHSDRQLVLVVIQPNEKNDDDDDDEVMEEKNAGDDNDTSSWTARAVDSHKLKSRKDEVLFPVHSIVSWVGQGSNTTAWIATLSNTSTNGDQNSRIEVFCMTDHDSLQHVWTLPHLDTPGTAIAILPPTDSDGKDDSSASLSSSPRLVVAEWNFGVSLFDMENKCLATWSEEARSLSKSIPTELRHRRDYPVRVVFDPANLGKILLGSSSAFVVYDLDKPFPTQCRCVPERHVRAQKRERSRSVSEENLAQHVPDNECTLCLRYNSILYMGFVGSQEMVVVEQPWMQIVSGFPPPLQRRVYGT